MSRTQTYPRPPAVPVPEAMADYIIDRMAAVGSVDRDMLLLRFSGEQIDKHFAAATDIAREKGVH
ncbi:hypothetical protein SAMN04515666_11950 [Bosea lupini]|uniref:Uncharacterized protein n=1 Tax=Bosea lupini TaxID=1036779 RepID=A0A1H8AGP1_9HYPH|nr:hypothetical protein [Bosea lupini]SEM69771.1 hypothetical protein SAMN04515666_11950 [Bosea lupini]